MDIISFSYKVGGGGGGDTLGAPPPPHVLFIFIDLLVAS